MSTRGNGRQYLSIKMLPDDSSPEASGTVAPVIIARVRRGIGVAPIIKEALENAGWSLVGRIKGNWALVYGVPPNPEDDGEQYDD